MYSVNPLPTGDTQEQVAEQDEDSDDVPGRCYKPHVVFQCNHAWIVFQRSGGEFRRGIKIRDVMAGNIKNNNV